jgi:translocation and assembly module TamA
VGASEVPAFNELPVSYRFFAGGDYSVRGYGYKSLGPTDSLGQVVGGQNLLVGSVEYNFPLRGIMEGAVFYDAGNAFDDLDINAQQGAGFGLRWRLPVGAIRVDLASALSKQGQPWRFHLTIGMEL